MYTSCPECGTVFRISTTELRVAEGYVRCGHCSATFNAIATLTDEPPPTVTLQKLVLPTEPEPEASPAPPPAPPDTEPVPEPEPARLPGFPAEPAEPPAPPEPEETTPDLPLAVSDDTLEFDIPEDSWSNFFEAEIPAPAPAVAAGPETESKTEPKTESESERESDAEAPADPPATAPDIGTGAGSDTVDQAGLYKALAAETGLNPDDDADWQALLAEVRDDEAAPEPVYVIGEEEIQDPPEELPLPDVSWDEPAAEDTRAPAPLPPDFAPELRPPGAADEPGPELTARREPSIADRPFIWEPPAPPPPETGRHWGYTAGSILAVLLLAAQLLHRQRDELATNPSLTEPLRRTYAALGMPLWPAWDLRSYEMRSSEAVADRSSPGALDILGRIAVVGKDRVGLPLVRVTLRDRFGESLGSRVFQPAEYLARNAQLREPVSPGTLIPVEISLKDPGRNAQGFDVDVCVMSRRDGVTCRGDREPFAR
ncbi:MAG: DUF3426 domain-containing protein [Chromatiales bacterium]|nr:DUF3426 domain-containing protein [Chromatiales bacterium]